MECDNDAEAVDRFIAARLRPCSAKLWERGRRVAELAPDGSLAMGDLAARPRSA